MSDSDDDVPIAALAKIKAGGSSEKKKKPPAKKQVASSAAAEDSEDDKPIGQLKGAAKRKRASTSPAGGAKKGKAKPAAKKAPPKKKAPSSDEEEADDDEEEEDMVFSDDEEEEEEDDESDFESSEEEEAPKKKKGKATPVAKGSTTKGKKAAPARKKPPAKKKAPAKKGAAAGKKKATGGAGRVAKVKKEAKEKEQQVKTALSSKAVRLEQAMQAFKWWDEEPLPDGIQWGALEHNGLFFPPEYVPHGVKMRYDGREVELPPELEEVATFFASMPPDGPQLGNPETAQIFVKNFFSEFKQMLRDKLDDDLGMKDFGKCDFEALRAHLEQQKMIKKAATNEEKARTKQEKEARQDFYGYAVLDGRIEKVGNYNMEPPGLFRGRGMHPLMGMIKKRCMPESIAINVGPDARPPPCPLPGHAWDRVQHDNKVTWLASWKENVLNGVKYVMLAASSSFKGKSDKEKYDKAARLKLYIDKIRRDYQENLVRKDRATRQIATAMWIIDKLALRVGGEKGEDEADTVGCCSLRVEHLKFAPDGPGGEAVPEIELEFLGKDSMLFKQTIDFGSYGEHGVQVFKNLRHFCKEKKPEQDVFEELTPSLLNAHLSSLMPGLSAKVFRTYNASETLQKELPTPEALEGMSVQDKVLAYNEANRKVAILCNHQRTVTKSMETALGNLQERLTLLKEQKRELAEQLKILKSGKNLKNIRTRSGGDKLTEAAAKALEKAEEKKRKATTPEDKVAAAQAVEAAKELKKQAGAAKAMDAHLFARTPSQDQVERQLERWAEKIKKLELDIRNKDDNKEVALGTSKINYMDPRISVAWCKRCEVPIERVFAKTLRGRFVWAMGVSPDWRFEGKKKKKKEEEEAED